MNCTLHTSVLSQGHKCLQNLHPSLLCPTCVTVLLELIPFCCWSVYDSTTAHFSELMHQSLTTPVALLVLVVEQRTNGFCVCAIVLTCISFLNSFDTWLCWQHLTCYTHCLSCQFVPAHLATNMINLIILDKPCSTSSSQSAFCPCTFWD